MARFSSVDPISDKFPHVSGFNYAENSPISNIDLHGLQKREFMGLHDPLAQQSVEQGGKEQLKQDIAAYYRGVDVGLTIGATAASAILPGPEDAVLAYAAATRVGAAVIKGLSKLGDGIKSFVKSSDNISNPVPDKMARVIPDDLETSTLGAPGKEDVFVTTADDIKGLNANEVANKLTIPKSESGFKVIEFDTPQQGVASPVNRQDPGFIGGGKTAGGAREYVVPNQKIPENAKTTKVD